MAMKLFTKHAADNVFEQIVDDASVSDADAPGDTSDQLDPDTETSVVSAEDAGVADEPAAGPPGHRRRLHRAMVATGVGIFAATLGALAFLGWQDKQHADVANASRAALASAQSYAATLTSIDANRVDDNFAKVVDGATGEFKDMYSQSAAQLRQVLIDNKAMSKGTVVDAAVKSATKDRVEVLMFIDQSISNVANPDARLDRSRIAMTMERINGRWLASEVELK